MKKKIIITGGLGYIGTELCKLYSGTSWHHKITVIDNRFISERVNQIRNWNMQFIQGNILDKDLYQNENIVKVITKENLDKSEFPEAINFMRKSNDTKKNIYHHLGIYCYQLKTLKYFVSLSRSQNEVEYRLEQLRALDNNIKINVALAKTSPIGVDTKEDFVAIKKIMEYNS